MKTPLDMNSIDPAWERRSAELWGAIDEYEPEMFVERVKGLAAELAPSHPVGLFEMASAQDSTGHPDLAVALYRAALNAGLVGLRRRRATIQLASSLRNLGNPKEAANLLTAELDAGADELDGAVRAFLALALATSGASVRP
jgi:Tetratrico peptide repeat